MAEAHDSGHGGLLDMERELTCSICTDILYQPLTLLDCLHTFCGSCLKEWFAFQAASAADSRRVTQPYTCPSCRESVRGTKADWRLTTLLEGYLKANPDRGKSDVEKEEMRKIYKPGDDVTPKVDIRREESDSEDERLMAEIRELSMAGVDPETARRRAERAARHARERRRREGRAEGYPQYRPRNQPSSVRVTGQVQLSEERLRQHNADEPQVEHQPSLRSLLSASPIDSQDVQQEILQTIYAEGSLEGYDLDHLTPEQEEELTERIAEAVRRRQRRRDRSRDREQRSGAERSLQLPTPVGENHNRHHTRTESATLQQQRPRPPISRPHLFEHTSQDAAVRQRRSPSTTSQRSNHTATRAEGPTPAARSATDLTEQVGTEEARRDRHRRMSSNARSTTDPENQRSQIHRMRASSANTRALSSEVLPVAHPLEAVRRQTGPTNNSSPSLPTSVQSSASPPQHSVRPATSSAAFAPEPVSNLPAVPTAPLISCARCEMANIQHDVHYHCPRCRNGTFDLCISCYRNGQGCDHWFGFGFMAERRWQQLAQQGATSVSYERPHVLSARRYPKSDTAALSPGSPPIDLQEGAFCESCFDFANDCYWYCTDCLDGAWGYCDHCVHQGKHCTHPLLPVAHLSTLRQPFLDPTRATFVPMPHLRPDSYVLWPVSTDCDICRRKIPPNSTRFHCYQCSDGDYDVCTECYHGLVATGKISQANGPNGWRRCLQGHRVAILGFQDVPNGGQRRVIVRERVGGLRHGDAEQQPSSGLSPPTAEDNAKGKRCIASYNYFPREAGADDLTFPRNAEITEVKEENRDWFSGVYAGKLGLFPSSHVRLL